MTFPNDDGTPAGGDVCTVTFSLECPHGISFEVNSTASAVQLFSVDFGEVLDGSSVASEAAVGEDGEPTGAFTFASQADFTYTWDDSSPKGAQIQLRVNWRTRTR